MKPIDIFLQRWRMRMAAVHISAQSRVIDIGAHRGEFFRLLGDKLQSGFGIEPLLREPLHAASFSIFPGLFPAVKPQNGEWDAITMLAVLEHIPRATQTQLVAACYDLLKSGGKVIITVPSPFVDKILHALRATKLIDGMSLEEHFGFLPSETPTLFSAPRFSLVSHTRFQLGLNHLFVLRKNALTNPPPEPRSL
jgi:SAM-dependent methyltransferase